MTSLFQNLFISLSFLSGIRFLSLVIGIFLLWQVLSRFFEWRVVWLTTILILFGTNIFWFSVFSDSPAHTVLFTLFLLIIRLTLPGQQKLKWIRLAAMLPVMILISFLNAPGIFILMFPVFAWIQDSEYGIQDSEYRIRDTGCGMRRSIISGAHWSNLLFLAGIFFLCIVLRQLHRFTGPGEIFYFGKPLPANFSILPANIHRILFSFKNGWLIYTPLVVFSFAGFYFLAEKNRVIYFPSFLFLFVSLIYVASLSQWWDNASFGYSNLVEIFSVLSIPLGYFIHWTLHNKRIVKVFLFGFSAMLIMLNLFQTWQFSRSIIVPERMTARYYFRIFGKTNVSAMDKILMETSLPAPADTIPGEKDITVTLLTGYNFEQSGQPWDYTRSEKFAHTGKYSLRMNPAFRYSPGLSIPLRQVTSGDSAWIRATAFFYYRCKPSTNIVFLVFTCFHNGAPYKYRQTGLMSDRFIPNRWNRLSISYQLPLSPYKNDSLRVYFWNDGEQECYLDDIKIELCKPTLRP